MAFRKDGGFGGGQGGKKSFGGARFAGKKSFGQGSGAIYGGSQKELFSAICAKCGESCEVPFKPSGDRPVYCRNCFGGKDSGPRNDLGRRDNPRSFDRRGPLRDFSPRAPHSAAGEKRFDELRGQIDSVHNKLDIVVKMIEKLTPAVKSELAHAVIAAVEAADFSDDPERKSTKKKSTKKQK